MKRNRLHSVGRDTGMAIGIGFMSWGEAIAVMITLLVLVSLSYWLSGKLVKTP